MPLRIHKTQQAMSMTDQAKQEVERLLLKGEKIGAIKHLKDIYGFSLEQSTILVEAMEGKTDPASASPYLNLAKATLDESAKAHVTDLLKSGKKILAIRYVKDTLKVRLKDAKKTVEELEKTIPGITTDTSLWAYRPLVLVLLVFGSLGLAMLGIAGYIFYSQSTSIETSDLITGQVIRMKADGDGMTAPVIEYEWKGQKWLHVSTTYSSPPAYTLNEKVPIFVNRKDPTDITIDTFMDRWFIMTILGSMGSVFAGIPILIACLGGWRKQRMNR